MLKFVLLILMCVAQVWAQGSNFASGFSSEPSEDTGNSLLYVTRYGMRTARSKNFKDLAENLFPNPLDRKEMMGFLIKHNLLKRSLPDVMVDGTVITIKERKKNSSLDLSHLSTKKLIFNKEVISFTGKENFIDMYLKLRTLHEKQKVTKWSWVLPEAQGAAKNGLPVLAIVTLASYARASVMDHMGESACPQNQDVCENHALNIKKKMKNLVVKSCSQAGAVLSFSYDEFFQGKIKTLHYNLELSPAEEPMYASWIKVTSDKHRCEFNLVENGYGTQYVPECYENSKKLGAKDLKSVDYLKTTNKNFDDLIKCCGSEACLKHLPFMRGQADSSKVLRIPAAAPK